MDYFFSKIFNHSKSLPESQHVPPLSGIQVNKSPKRNSSAVAAENTVQNSPDVQNTVHAASFNNINVQTTISEVESLQPDISANLNKDQENSFGIDSFCELFGNLNTGSQTKQGNDNLLKAPVNTEQTHSQSSDDEAFAECNSFADVSYNHANITKNDEFNVETVEPPLNSNAAGDLQPIIDVNSVVSSHSNITKNYKPNNLSVHEGLNSQTNNSFDVLHNISVDQFEECEKTLEENELKSSLSAANNSEQTLVKANDEQQPICSQDLEEENVIRTNLENTASENTLAVGTDLQTHKSDQISSDGNYLKTSLSEENKTAEFGECAHIGNSDINWSDRTQVLSETIDIHQPNTSFSEGNKTVEFGDCETIETSKVNCNNSTRNLNETVDSHDLDNIRSNATFAPNATFDTENNSEYSESIVPNSGNFNSFEACVDSTYIGNPISELINNDSINLATDGVVTDEAVSNAFNNTPAPSGNIINNTSSNSVCLENSDVNRSASGRLNISIRQDLFPSPKAEVAGAESTQYSNRQEQSNLFMETMGDNLNATFKKPKTPSSKPSASSIFGNYDDNLRTAEQSNLTDEDFQSGNMIFQSSDFDCFLTRSGSGTADQTFVNRDSLLLNFDPLLGRPVLVEPNVQRLSVTEECTESVSSDDGHINYTRENDERYNLSNTLPLTELYNNHSEGSADESTVPQALAGTRSFIVTPETGNDTMSVGLIHAVKPENDLKQFESVNTLEKEDKSDKDMAELERKMKVELLRSEDVEKKLRDAEQREQSLLKRITDKDKAIAKMSGVLEEYEKAIAELISEKQQIIQSDELKMVELKADRDLNFQHLTSLEATFSDLHAKYERSKQITAELKSTEEALIEEKNKMFEQLKLQEQRYEKMKNHALQQLEIANNKLEVLTKNHAVEMTKLRAQLKKEEISRQSLNEQLVQKAKENEELVKICDELINGQGS